MQARGKRLLEPYEQIPGPELAAMSVPRKLQIEAGLNRRARRARLVGEKNLHGGIRGGTRERRRGITALLGIEMMGAEVGHPSQNQWLAVMPYHDMLVEQHA